MRGLFILFLTTVVFSGCSLLNKTAQKETIQITDQELIEVINASVEEMVSQYWLSDFLTNSQKRPILITSAVTTPSHVVVNKELAYSTFDLSLLKTGQVRVVKSNAEQRNTLPHILASGESVDFVISTQIEEISNENGTTYFLTTILSNELPASPITTIKKEIKHK